MSDRQFIHCRVCRDVFRPSPLDRQPEFRLTDEGLVPELRDDCMTFLTEHARHALETLRPTGTPPLHEGSFTDPMANVVWEVSNGADVMLVESSRAALDEPLRYSVRPGRLVVEPPSIEIEEAEIRGDVDRALFPGTAPDRKLDAFVARFKQIAWDADPAALEVVYDVPCDPTLSVARLPAEAVARLLVAAREVFGDDDAARIATRLAENADTDAFTVLLRQRIRVAA